MEAKGQSANRARRVASGLLALLAAYVAAFVPALIAIYHPHQYADEPLFSPPALNGAVWTVLVAVPLIWLFARKWDKGLVARLFAAGIVLTVLALAMIGVAMAMGPDRQSVPMFFAQILGNLAIPCVGLLAPLWVQGGRHA